MVIQIVSKWQIEPVINGEIRVYWDVIYILSCELWIVQSHNCKIL